ncbi:MAG TPA: YgaP-like transmembrane domain [Polyangia bacterium]|jgi:uncharacterized membrane protein|nr:YgaP-like transmembrane domain [Polyangia bacterium]
MMGTSIQTNGAWDPAGWQPLLEAKQGSRSQNLGPFARTLSVVVGSAALAAGLRLRSPLRWALVVAGAFGLRRGVTGHCALYEKLGASSYEHPPHASVHESVTIAHPRADVERLWALQAPGLLGPLYGKDVRVHFADAPGGQGTEITLMATVPVRSGAELLFGVLRGRTPAGQLHDVLRRFKARIEAGEVPALAPPVPTDKAGGRFLA